MGLLEQMLTENRTVIEAFLKLLEGKESKAKIDLAGVKFNIGKSVVKAEGTLSLTLIPLSKAK